MSLNYTKKTLDHFRNPKNIGELKKADATAIIGNMICGDQLSFSIKVKDNIIKDIKFLSFGCASNIATASVMTEIVKGMTLDEAKKFNWDKIVSELGGLPKQKIHCSVLAVDALIEAVYDYSLKNKIDISADLKKRHEVIKKSKEIIEKRYDKWTD